MPRYIDAEKVKHTVNEFIDRTGSDVFTREHIFDFLYETDSADVQEVKHGIWKSTGFYGFRCSVCGEHICMPEDHIANYCPNCGARMDGDKK